MLKVTLDVIAASIAPVNQRYFISFFARKETLPEIGKKDEAARI